MDIEYVASTRARAVRIRVEGAGNVRVTYPYRLSRLRVVAWVNERASWIADAQRKMQARGGTPLPRGAEGRALFLQHKKEVRKIVERYLGDYAHEFVWKKVRITNAKTRWGSCSMRGTLSFNWRMIYLTPEVQRYLIVHELCHLRHHNHSARFWAEVARFSPQYVTLRRILKQYHF